MRVVRGSLIEIEIEADRNVVRLEFQVAALHGGNKNAADPVHPAREGVAVSPVRFLSLCGERAAPVRALRNASPIVCMASPVYFPSGKNVLPPDGVPQRFIQIVGRAGLRRPGSRERSRKASPPSGFDPFCNPIREVKPLLKMSDVRLWGMSDHVQPMRLGRLLTWRPVRTSLTLWIAIEGSAIIAKAQQARTA